MIDKMKTFLSPNRFIPNDYEELTALELIGKQNAKIDEVVEGTNKNESNIKNKLDINGDFLGSWHGITHPVFIEGGQEAVILKNSGDIENILKSNLNIFMFKGDSPSQQLLNAIKFASSNGYKEVFIPSGEYMMTETIELEQAFKHVSLRGENTKTTILNFENVSGVGIKVKGGSGDLSHACISNLTIRGNVNSTGVQLSDTNGFYVDNCRFEKHAVGVEFYNEHGFTEYSIIKYCDFKSSCKSAVKFSVKDGNEHISMHGSGLDHVTINQSDTSDQSPIVIGKGVLLYNSPLSFSIWTRSNIPIISHNGNQNSYTYGQICNETFGNNVVKLCDGVKLYHMGFISSWGKQLKHGNFELINSIRLNDGKREVSRKPYVSFDGAITNNITHVANIGSDSIMNVNVWGNFYRYQGTFIIGKNLQVDELTITNLQEHHFFDQLSKGKVTFDSNGNDVRLKFTSLVENANCHVSITPLFMGY